MAVDMGQCGARRHLIWLPVRDFLSAGVWFAGLAGKQITWRGAPYRLLPDGRLFAASAVRGDRVREFAAAAVRRLDRALRRYLRIYEFTNREDCLIRLSLGVSDSEVQLSDGTRVRPGECIGELHFWNEHVPPMGKEGPSLAWAVAFERALRNTLAEFADYVGHDAELRAVQAFRAELMFASRNQQRILGHMQARFGFEEVSTDRHRRGLLKQMHEMADDVLRWGLIWAFNPNSLKGNWFAKRRHELWITRDVLISRFGTRGAGATGKELRLSSN
jgi:hypothetical protein